MLKYLYSALLSTLLGGCMVAESGHEVKEEAAAKQPEKAALQKIPDDLTVGSQPLSSYSYRDPVTGTNYLINPNWKIMPRKSAALAKTAGAIQTWTDWSGQVETRIYECITPTAAQHQNSIGCQVEQGFTLVGGGAYADYGTGAGALLWESRALDPTLTTWVASSKDHITGCLHILHTYAIGMRLKGNDGVYISKATLMTYMKYGFQWSGSYVHMPAAAVGQLLYQGSYSNMLYTGGGGRSDWTCCGSLLTQSEIQVANGTTSSYAASKDHISSDPSIMQVSGIAFVQGDGPLKSIDIPNFGSLEFRYPTLKGNGVSTGVGVAYRDVDEEFVITGMGGQSAYTSGPGRMLFGIKPTGTNSGQVGVFSKDHKSVSGGYNMASLTEVRKSH